MLRKILVFAVPLVIVLLLARLPIFPLVSEVREFSQDGESLYQTWDFVTIPEFYDAARFAKTGWLDSTWRNYLVLAVVNHAGLVVVFFAVRGVFCRLINKGR